MDILAVHQALKTRCGKNYFDQLVLTRESKRHCSFKYEIVVSNVTANIATDMVVRDDYNSISNSRWYRPTVVKTVQNALDSFIMSERKKSPTKTSEEIISELLQWTKP